MLRAAHFSNLGRAENIAQYLELVLEKRQVAENEWIFRGQRDGREFPTPKIDRPAFRAYREHMNWTREKHEDRLLTDFKKGALPHIQVAPASIWEWLAVAQHHGLATRLLDWTANPLAALFFVVERPESSVDGVVWCYHHAGNSWMHPDNKEHPFKLKAITSFWPPHVSPRITVQGGCFTAHPEIPKVQEVMWPGDLWRIDIAREARSNLRSDLLKLGVNRAALFPDLDGIAITHNRRLSSESARPVG